MNGKTSIGSALAVVAMLALEPWSPRALAREQEPGPAIEKEALATLEEDAGAYLRSLKAFQVAAETTTEEVLDDGQKVSFEGNVNGLARMPDRLRLTTTSDRRDRLYLYDGKQFTMVAQRVNFYATVAAPATIGQLADELDNEVRHRPAARGPVPVGRRAVATAGITRRCSSAPAGGRRQLRPLRVPAGRARLAGVDPDGRLPAAPQAGAHHDH